MKKSSTGMISHESISKIRAKVMNDQITLQMLCQGLALDSFEIALCLSVYYDNDTSNDNDLTLLQRVEQYQNVISSSQLWDIVKESMIDDIGRFFVIDDECKTLFKIACKREDVYLLLTEQLREAINNITHEHIDLNENLVQVLQKLIHEMRIIQNWKLPYHVNSNCLQQTIMIATSLINDENQIKRRRFV
jgi:hypothetical protein